MTKDKLKDDIIRTICCLNSDISIEGRELLIKLLNMIGVFMLKIEKKMSNLKHNML